MVIIFLDNIIMVYITIEINIKAKNVIFMHSSPPNSQKYTQEEQINKKPICMKNKTKLMSLESFHKNLTC